MTNLNKKNIYVSLLPLFVIIALIIGAGYFLLADEIKFPKFNKGPQIRRINGFPTNIFVDANAKAEKQRLVIKSEKDLDNFLNSVDKSGMLQMHDKINFDKEYLIAVSTEVEQVDGHRVKIKKVYEDKAKKTLLVSISEIFPGQNCVPEQNPHLGVDIVAINKTDWKIDFEKVKDADDCSKPESSSSN